MRRLAALLLLSLSAGCYTYVPVELATVPQGERVRVHLTREGVAALPDLGESVERVLDGTVESRSPDQIVVRVPVAARREGFLSSTLGQNVAVALGHVDRVETRRLSRSRTGLAVIGTAGAVAAVVFTILDGSIMRDPPGPGGGDDLRGPTY